MRDRMAVVSFIIDHRDIPFARPSAGPLFVAR